VSSDRVTRAPTPDGTLGGEAPRTESPATSRANTRNADNGTSTDEGQQKGADEYVFERIVGTRQASDGTLRYRVRWYGYSRDEDTWEPQDHLPISAVRRYHRRVGLPMMQ
jgi:Chromo (CHRromatin Organisation MOdifier) domain